MDATQLTWRADGAEGYTARTDTRAYTITPDGDGHKLVVNQANRTHGLRGRLWSEQYDTVAQAQAAAQAHSDGCEAPPAPSVVLDRVADYMERYDVTGAAKQHRGHLGFDSPAAYMGVLGTDKAAEAVLLRSGYNRDYALNAFESAKSRVLTYLEAADAEGSACVYWDGAYEEEGAEAAAVLAVIRRAAALARDAGE
jgi:hypothetical protein